jgi:SAM-dependent methyltransferase
VDLIERGEALRRHPWEVARAGFFRRLIGDHFPSVRTCRILDVGAGDGYFAGELGQTMVTSSEIVCWDVNYRSADLDVDLPPGVERTANEPNGTFDVVLMLDVIEHIADDAAFLDTSILPHLADDSVVIISVPAYQRLFSSHDEALGHHRRYSPRQLRDLLQPRLDVVARGGLFTSLLPLRAADVARERLARSTTSQGVGNWTAGPTVTRALETVLAADARLGRWFSGHRITTPGLSTWAVCRPPVGSMR